MSWAVAFILIALIIAVVVVTGIMGPVIYIVCFFARIGIALAAVISGRRSASMVVRRPASSQLCEADKPRFVH